MILTSAEYIARLDYGPRDGFNLDMAQTVASWWYSPGSPAMVALVTRRVVVAGLADEVDLELRTPGLSGDIRADLERLAAWVRDQQPIVVITPEREAEAREELITLLDEMTAAAG